MSNNCPICHRSLGTAYHGKIIKKNFCCSKCEKYFKEHFCTMHMRGENRNNCNNKLFNTEKKFCSEVCKKKFFETGKKPLDIRECSKCKGIKHYINFCFMEIIDNLHAGIAKIRSKKILEKQILFIDYFYWPEEDQLEITYLLI